MNNYFKIITACLALFCVLMLPQYSSAQWSIGASYEIRDEDPQNGFGVRLERGLLGKMPVFDLRIRAHFSYFSEDNYVGENQISYGSIENYDFGLAGVAGVSVGLIKPYLGVGLGSTTVDLEAEDAAFNEPESKLFWNGFVGAELSPIPAIKPFVEYRLQAAQSFEALQNAVNQSNGRLIFGISLAF
jgi:hypothetical protein